MSTLKHLNGKQSVPEREPGVSIVPGFNTTPNDVTQFYQQSCITHQ